MNKIRYENPYHLFNMSPNSRPSFQIIVCNKVSLEQSSLFVVNVQIVLVL